MALDPQRNRLDALQQQESAHGRQNGTRGPQVNTAAARDVRRLLEMFGIDQIVIREVRLSEHRETLSVLHPGEPAAIDDDSAERRAVPAHELRQRMHHNVCAVFDRPQQDGRCDRIVDDKRNAVIVGHARERLEVTNVSRRISDAFAKDAACFVIDQPFDGVGLIRLRKADIDPLTWQNVSEQCVRGAVKLRSRNDVAA